MIPRKRGSLQPQSWVKFWPKFKWPPKISGIMEFFGCAVKVPDTPFRFQSEIIAQKILLWHSTNISLVNFRLVTLLVVDKIYHILHLPEVLMHPFIFLFLSVIDSYIYILICFSAFVILRYAVDKQFHLSKKSYVDLVRRLLNTLLLVTLRRF